MALLSPQTKRGENSMRKRSIEAKLGNASPSNTKQSGQGFANWSLMMFSLLATGAYLAAFASALYFAIGPYHTAASELPLIPDLTGRPRFFLALFCASVSILMAYGVWQVLSRKEDMPDGIEVTRENGKTLWRAVEKVFPAAGTAPPDRIFLLPEMNAFAAEIKVKRFSSRKTRVLGLGYPLLKVLTLEQAAAVIAHEAAHFEGKDNRASRMHFNTISAAQALICGPESDRTGFTILAGWLLVIPAAIYIGLASMLGARISRQNELRADACAAQLFGVRNTADALIVLEVIGEEFEEIIWQPMIDAWRKGVEMPTSIMLAVADRAHDEVENNELVERLAHALERKTGRFDNHPSLDDRMKGIGAEAAIPNLSGKMTGAAGLLYDDEDALRTELDKFIFDKFGDSFEKRREEVREAKQIVAQEFHRLDDSRNPRLAAELISLLIERSLHGDEFTSMHREIIQKYGAIPSSTCDLAQAKLDAKDASGAEEMLAIYEKHPLMSGEAKSFLQWANCVREDIPVSAMWLKNWLSDPATAERMEKAFDREMEIAGQYVEICERRPKPGIFHTPRWHRELIIKEVCAIWNVRRIWLAEDCRPEGETTPLVRLLVETANEEPVYPQVSVSIRTLTPGFLSWMAGGPMEIAEEPVWRDIRDFDAGMIYENLDGSGEIPVKKAA